MDNLMIEIPIKTTCDPSVLLDLAIEASEQFVEEIRMHDGEATVDEEEVLVRPAGLTTRERELLAALQAFVDACSGHFDELVIAKMRAKALITKASGGAK